MKHVFFLMLGMFLSMSVRAQDAESPITYKNLGMQYSTFNLNGNAASLAVPSYAMYNGLGSYADNPAVTALARENEVSFGLYYGANSQTSDYFGQTGNERSGNFDFGDLGMLYKYPTTRGSFVIGAGYNLLANEKYHSFLDARNNASTITDVFKNPSSSYHDIAYNTFAIDYGDVTGTYYESIFRIGFLPSEYPGITQYVDISRSRRMGEFNLFAATEFQKNLFFGFSVGLLTGTSKYNRDFQEYDEFNNYDGDFIGADVNGLGGTDIDLITINDNLSSNIFGVIARAGMVYRVNDIINLGASFTLPAKLKINEKFSASIKSDFDDGSESGKEEVFGEFDYAVTRPFQFGVGASIRPVRQLTLTAALENINYSRIRVSLNESDSNAPIDIADLRLNEKQINNAISKDYNNVYNIKTGALYKTVGGLELKAGYSMYQPQSRYSKVQQNIYWNKVVTGGVSFPVADGLFFDLTAQYLRQNNRSLLYNYPDPLSGELSATEYGNKVELFNIVAGIKIKF